MDAIEETQQYSLIRYNNFDHATRLPHNLQEAVMMKNYRLADVIVNTGYFALTAGALLFVSILLLTTIHP